MLALDELPDLAAESAKHVEQCLVRLADFPAEKLHDAHDFAGHGYREPKRGSQTLFRRDRRPRKIRILRDVGNPCGLRQFPHTPRHAFAARKDVGARGHLELGSGGMRPVPDFDTAQPVLLHHPKRSHAPLERLADGP